MKDFKEFNNDDFLLLEGKESFVKATERLIRQSTERLKKIFSWPEFERFFTTGGKSIEPAVAKGLRGLGPKGRVKVLEVLKPVEDVLGKVLVLDLAQNVKWLDNRLVINSRLGNTIDLDKIVSAVNLHKASKLNKQQFDNFIKILPERFPDGRLCASKFRETLTKVELKLPQLKVKLGIKFSTAEQAKVLRNLEKIERHWDPKTWTQSERDLGYKEFIDEMETLVLPDEWVGRKISAGEDYNFAKGLLDQELAASRITKPEYDELLKGFGKIDWKNWSVTRDGIPKSLKYAKRKVRFRIWDKQKYLESVGKTEYTSQGNCDTYVNTLGKTETIVNLIPKNWKKPATRDDLKNIIYHEIGHAKDQGLRNRDQLKGYRKDYRPTEEPDLTEIDKKYYSALTKKGKMTKKEWDKVKNYFVHPIENKVIFRAMLEDMRSNLSKWIKNRVKEYNNVGYEGTESKKAAMQDAVTWLKQVQNLFKSSYFATDKIAKGEFTKELQDGINRYYDLLGYHSGVTMNIGWINDLRKYNPKGFEEYRKKVATQIDDWIKQIELKANESLDYSTDKLKEIR